MAKPFYSLEEVCSLLGKNEDGVKSLVRDGQLREFRDAGKVFFKADDVEKLRKSSGASASGELTLESADDELPNLAGTGSGLGLADDAGKGGTSLIGLAPAEEEPPPGDKKAGTVLSASGIGVFDDDELEIDVDPLAATHVSGAATRPPAKPKAKADDASALEGTGSGLLDLQREADDTKLGAELLDEIYPGEEDEGMLKTPTPAPPAPRAAARPEPEEEEEEVEEARVTPTPVFAGAAVATAVDPLDGMFGGLAAGALIPLVLAGSVAAASVQGFMPDYVDVLVQNFWFFLGGAVLVTALGLLIGWLVGRGGR